MDVGPLRSFVAVAREAHLTRAAIGLGLTQPAVSGHVARVDVQAGRPAGSRAPGTSAGEVSGEAGPSCATSGGAPSVFALVALVAVLGGRRRRR